MVALQTQTVEGRSVATGEVFHVDAITAASLRYLRKADFATHAQLQTKVETAEPEPSAASVPARRRYRRRDLTADPQ